MLLGDAILLAAVFAGSQLLGFFFSIPGTTIDPHSSVLARLAGSLQLTGTIYAIQHFHLQIEPEAAFDSVRQPDTEPLLGELNSMVQTATDEYFRSRVYTPSLPFELENGTSIERHPVIQALDEYLDRFLYPETPEDSLSLEWTIIAAITLLLVYQVGKGANRGPARPDGYYDEMFSGHLSKLRVDLQQSMKETIDGATANLPGLTQSPGGGSDAFAAALESFRESLGVDDVTSEVERIIQQHLQPIHDENVGNEALAARLDACKQSVGQLSLETGAIRQDLQGIRSRESDGQPLGAVKEELLGDIADQIKKATQTEFEKLRINTANLEKTGESKDPTDEASLELLRDIRDTRTEWQEKFTDLRQSNDSIPALVKESIDALRNPQPIAQATEALDSVRTHIVDQLHTLNKRIDGLEKNGSDYYLLKNRVTELGNQLMSFKDSLNDLENESNASASMHTVDQLENTMNEYIGKWSAEMEKVKSQSSSAVESTSQPLREDLSSQGPSGPPANTSTSEPTSCDQVTKPEEIINEPKDQSSEASASETLPAISDSPQEPQKADWSEKVEAEEENKQSAQPSTPANKTLTPGDKATALGAWNAFSKETTSTTSPASAPGSGASTETTIKPESASDPADSDSKGKSPEPRNGENANEDDPTDNSTTSSPVAFPGGLESTENSPISPSVGSPETERRRRPRPSKAKRARMARLREEERNRNEIVEGENGQFESGQQERSVRHESGQHENVES